MYTPGLSTSFVLVLITLSRQGALTISSGAFLIEDGRFPSIEARNFIVSCTGLRFFSPNKLKLQGEVREDEMLSHISLLPYKHVLPNGTYFIE